MLIPRRREDTASPINIVSSVPITNDACRGIIPSARKRSDCPPNVDFLPAASLNTAAACSPANVGAEKASAAAKALANQSFLGLILAAPKGSQTQFPDHSKSTLVEERPERRRPSFELYLKAPPGDA